MKKVNEIESPIKLKGNDIHVNGKSVGKISNDIEDKKGSIEFTGLDGKKQKFATLPALYKHLGDAYKLKESADIEKQSKSDTIEHFEAKLGQLRFQLKDTSDKAEKDKIAVKIKSYEQELEKLKKQGSTDK